MIVRKAMIHDIEDIYLMIEGYALEGLLLPRTRLSLYEHIQCITVAELDGKIVGACSLHVLGRDLGEIRSLVVARDVKGKGIGKKLVYACIQEAKKLGVEKVFTLTYQVEFFQKCEFFIEKMDSFPEKVWKDCVTCPKKDNCDETAMIYKPALAI